jgi:hypothetical protein
VLDFVLSVQDFSFTLPIVFRSKYSLLDAVLDSAFQFIKSAAEFVFFARTTSLGPSVTFVSPSVSFVARKDSLAPIDASTASCYALFVARRLILCAVFPFRFCLRMAGLSLGALVPASVFSCRLVSVGRLLPFGSR